MAAGDVNVQLINNSAIQCTKFDGVDNVVDITAQSSINNLFENGGTIAVWICPKSDGELDDAWICGKAIAQGWAFGLKDEAAGFLKIKLQALFSLNIGTWGSNAVVPINQWSHVAVAYNSSDTANDAVLYVNGQLVAVNETDIPLGVYSSDAAIDMHISRVTRCFDGWIRDLQLYKKILTAKEILQIFNNGPPVSDIVGHWKLQSDYLDSSGNGNNGANSGSIQGTWDAATTNTIAAQRIAAADKWLLAEGEDDQLFSVNIASA